MLMVPLFWDTLYILISNSEDRHKCDNFRLISMLPIISKMFEKEIFRHLFDLSNNSLLSKFQSGSCPKHSTVTALIQLSFIKVWIMES